MIEIKSNINGITIVGHANYAEPGKDIVCAGVSILVQTLISSIEKLTVDKIQYDIQPGAVNIKHGNLSDSAKLLIDSFFVGIQMIADNYPSNAKMTKH